MLWHLKGFPYFILLSLSIFFPVATTDEKCALKREKTLEAMMYAAKNATLY